MKRSTGFTLMEVLVAMTLAVFLVGAVIGMMMSSQKTLAEGSSSVLMNSQLRRVVDRMSRQLAQSQTGQVTDPAANGTWATSITFRIPEDTDASGSVLDAEGSISEWSDWITIASDGSNCILTTNGTDEILANHITDVQFRRQAATPEVVEIQLTATVTSGTNRIETRTLETKVNLRN